MCMERNKNVRDWLPLRLDVVVRGEGAKEGFEDSEQVAPCQVRHTIR